MPPPVLKTFAAELYDSLAPLTFADADNGYALAEYAAAFGEMFQKVEDYARDQELPGGIIAPGWSQVMDLDRAPSEALPWLAQFIGVILPPDLGDAARRQRIRETDGWNRGTPNAIKGAARQYLTGAQNVLLRERDGGAYKLTVITYTSQTPDQAKVLAALMAQKPAGIILTYNVYNGQDYQQLKTDYATYGDVRAGYATYNGLRQDTPGS